MKIPDKETLDVLKRNFVYIVVIIQSWVILQLYSKMISLYDLHEKDMEDKDKAKEVRIKYLEEDRNFWRESYFNARPHSRHADTAQQYSQKPVSDDE